MSERVLPGPIEDLRCVREAVCIHTRKIYDSCRDKDTASYRIFPIKKSLQENPQMKVGGFCFFRFRVPDAGNHAFQKRIFPRNIP